MMSKKGIVMIILMLLPVTGCASFGWLSSLFTVKAADEMNGIKNAKVADKAAVVDKSQKTETKNTAGGNIFTQATNDPLILISISGSLFTFMGTIMAGMYLTLRAKDKQISRLMEGQQKFIQSQEEGQQKYVRLLEEIAMSVITGKLKGGISNG